MNPSYWRSALAPYERPNVGRSLLDIATSVVPYLALWVLMYLALTSGVSYLLVVILTVPAAGFLVRTYIVFHDCAHGSFLPSRRANTWLGTFCGLLTFTPFAKWRHEHAVHHGTAGDLDRRGVGDVHTLTVAEYDSLSRRGRLAYRLFRNPLVMFGIGPIYAVLLAPRWISRDSRQRLRRSVIATDVALAALIGTLCWLVGWRDYLLVQMPAVFLAGVVGVWLFYVQHQFEDTYWQSSERWSYAEAALRGSSYLRLPRVLQFFTGNIGLHHVHHLSTRIPNYNLQRAHQEIEIFHEVPIVSLWDGIRAVRLKLWDEAAGRLVTFGEARSARSDDPKLAAATVR